MHLNYYSLNTGNTFKHHTIHTNGSIYIFCFLFFMYVWCNKINTT